MISASLSEQTEHDIPDPTDVVLGLVLRRSRSCQPRNLSVRLLRLLVLRLRLRLLQVAVDSVCDSYH